MERDKAKTMTLRNDRMMDMMSSLQPLLTRRDKLGYYAARNTRILGDALTEYISFRNQALRKYGTEDPETHQIQLKLDSPAGKNFVAEMAEFDAIEHKVSLHIRKFEDAVGCLTGEEILAVDWMLED